MEGEESVDDDGESISVGWEVRWGIIRWRLVNQ